MLLLRACEASATLLLCFCQASGQLLLRFCYASATPRLVSESRRFGNPCATLLPRFFYLPYIFLLFYLLYLISKHHLPRVYLHTTGPTESTSPLSVIDWLVHPVGKYSFKVWPGLAGLYYYRGITGSTAVLFHLSASNI